jgi:trigger factor
VERVDDTTVKLAVTVERPRVKQALDEAARHLAEEVKVPGFRKGKAPRKVLESRLGKGAVVQHAVQDSLPQFYAEAIRGQDLEPVGQPEFELDTFEEGADASFTATVEVRPDFEVPQVDDVLVNHPEWQVTDEEVTEELDRLRERFAEAETVNRPIQIGDLAVLTISGTYQGQPVEDASMDDQLYRIGDPDETGQKVDRELLGAAAGSIVKFNDTWDGDEERELNFMVIVKDVKTLQLPDADDDFAITASEFDTIDELRDDLRTQLAAAKLSLARDALRGRAVETVSELVDVPLPRSLVNEEVQFQLARLARDAERRQIPFDRYLQSAGTTFEDLQAQLEENARKTVRAQLVVDRIGREAGIEVTNEDLTRQVTEEAMRLNIPPQELAQFMSEPERLSMLFTDAFRRKTVEHILERIEVVDAPPDDVLAQAEADLEAAPGDGEEADGAGDTQVAPSEADDTSDRSDVAVE